MSQNCGSIEFLAGGTINQSSILNSQITNSEVQNSKLSSCSVESLKSVDDASAQVIADALAALPANKLQALVEKLMASMSYADAAEPATTDDAATPTTMYGTRNALLGTPVRWKSLPDGSRVPCY